MGMALKEDVFAASREAGTGKPIDLVHLSSSTMGDPALEAEILSMFSSQIPNYLELARNCCDDTEVRRAAHTIKGSARSIGAFELVELTEKFEDSGEMDLQALEFELLRVDQYIARLRG